MVDQAIIWDDMGQSYKMLYIRVFEYFVHFKEKTCTLYG